MWKAFVPKLLALSLLCATSSSQCAAVTAIPIFDDRGTITGELFKLSGPIQAGDAAKFAELLRRKVVDIPQVNLDTPGGDVREAMTLGEIVRAARLDTVVQAGATCASSCFLVWINGANRYVVTSPTRNVKTGRENPPGRLGIHRPFLTDLSGSAGSLNAQAAAMEAVSSYLRTKFVPTRLVDLMISTASNDIYWLTNADLTEMGEASPELQQLYVEKCDDERPALYRQITAARSRGGATLESTLQKSVRRINGCIDNLNAMWRASAIKNGFRDVLR